MEVAPDPVLLAHLVTTALYAGFQLTVRVVVYPQFAGVAAADWPAYERAHQRRVSWVVGPLFAGLVATTGALALTRPDGVATAAVALAVLLLLVVLGVTGLVAVPLHRRLETGWDVAAHVRLQRADTVRVVAAVADLALAVVLLAR